MILVWFGAAGFMFLGGIISLSLGIYARMNGPWAVVGAVTGVFSILISSVGGLWLAVVMCRRDVAPPVTAAVRLESMVESISRACRIDARGITAWIGGETMPIHDWTRVEAGLFHAFRFGWIVCANCPTRLNCRRTTSPSPSSYSRPIPDVPPYGSSADATNSGRLWPPCRLANGTSVGVRKSAPSKADRAGRAAQARPDRGGG